MSREEKPPAPSRTSTSDAAPSPARGPGLSPFLQTELAELEAVIGESAEPPGGTTDPPA